MTVCRRRTTQCRWIAIWSDKRKCKAIPLSIEKQRSAANKVNSRSGELNAKNRELLALQAQARARLAKTRSNFADGMRAAKETQRDLEWTQKKVT
jgi:hypothetical protein